MCLTRNRRRWIPNVLRSFGHQTYENRTMLILADGEDIAGVVPEDPRIRLVQLSESERPRTVGEKRNLACSLIEADIICVFDDDDFYAPERIARQVERLDDGHGANLKSATGYHSAIFTDGSKWWKYTGTADLAIGASLCFWKYWWRLFRFPHRQIGQDEEFARQAYASGELISVDAGQEMIFSVHPKNTSTRRTAENPYEEIPALGLPHGFAFPVW